MTREMLEILTSLPEKIDELTAKIKESNTKLKEQVLVTKQILSEMGVATASPPAAQASITVSQPAQELQLSELDEKIRQEQLNYLASRKAERMAAYSQVRGET